MLVLEVLTPRGSVQEIRCEKLLRVDGQPYQGQASDLRDTVIFLDGRLTALEQIIGTLTARDQANGR